MTCPWHVVCMCMLFLISPPPSLMLWSFVCVCCLFGSNKSVELQEQRRSFRFCLLIDVLAVPLGISCGSKISQCNIQFDTGVSSEFRTTILVDKRDTAAWTHGCLQTRYYKVGNAIWLPKGPSWGNEKGPNNLKFATRNKTVFVQFYFSDL